VGKSFEALCVRGGTIFLNFCLFFDFELVYTLLIPRTAFSTRASPKRRPRHSRGTAARARPRGGCRPAVHAAQPLRSFLFFFLKKKHASGNPRGGVFLFRWRGALQRSSSFQGL
jgi:hypothetical protein